MNYKDYNFELDKVIDTIKLNSSKNVLIQLPDGLKPLAQNLKEDIESKIDVEVWIWAGSNFGACDIPSDVEKLGIDLIIHFGHSSWKN